MKACPLRMLALGNNLENIRALGNASDIMNHGRELRIEATIGCLEERCAWWDGEACTVLVISEALIGIKDALDTIDLTICQKE